MTFIQSELNTNVVNLTPHFDQRGCFERLFCKKELKEIGLNKEIVQINFSSNTHRLTFRGFHYQTPPYCETKIITCISGQIQDYIIDLRKNSPTFLQNYSIKLSENNHKMLVIPEGFAHGYLTLEDNSQLIYMHTSYHRPQNSFGLNYKDPLLNIHLPFKPNLISPKDEQFELLTPDFSGILI